MLASSPRRQGEEMTAEDIRMTEALFYESVAQAWGWPPTVVDAQPYGLLTDMLKVAEIRAEVAEADERRAAARMEAQR